VQLVEPLAKMLDDARENVGKPSLRINIVAVTMRFRIVCKADALQLLSMWSTALATSLLRDSFAHSWRIQASKSARRVPGEQPCALGAPTVDGSPDLEQGVDPADCLPASAARLLPAFALGLATRVLGQFSHHEDGRRRPNGCFQDSSKRTPFPISRRSLPSNGCLPLM